MKERGELPNEVGDAVGECRAMHEKKKEGQKTEKIEEEKVKKRRKENRRKKRTKWERSKEDVRFLFLWWPLKSLAKGERSGE